MSHVARTGCGSGRRWPRCCWGAAPPASQPEDNLGALSWALTEEERQTLNEVSAPGIPLYPCSFLERYAGVDVWERLTGTTQAEAPPIGV
jgi:hypothetical protein